MQLEVRGKMDAAIRAMTQLYQTTILTLPDLNIWHVLSHQLAIQSVQLDLYQRELLQLTEHKLSTPQW